MEVLSQFSCKVANRVALGMRYGETSGHRVEAQQIVQEALGSSCELLDRIDPVELQQWFEQFHLVFEPSHQVLVDDPVVWSRFLASQCDMLHSVGFHQKTIAIVGDELAKWNRQPVEFSQFARSLDGMSELVTRHAASLGAAIEGQAGKEAKHKRRTEWFSNAVNGLSIVLVSIHQAIEAGDPRNFEYAAMGSFGAALTIASVAPLFQACDLEWA